MPEIKPNESSALTPTRRGVIRTAAWSVPAVTVATAAPAFAGSVSLPNLSTSTPTAPPTRSGNQVTIQPTQFNNTGDTAVAGLNVRFTTGDNVTGVAIFGIPAANLGITFSPALPSNDFVMSIPASLASVPANGSWTSTAAQVLTFDTSTPTLFQSTVTAVQGGVPYVSQQVTV